MKKNNIDKLNWWHCCDGQVPQKLYALTVQNFLALNSSWFKQPSSFYCSNLTNFIDYFLNSFTGGRESKTYGVEVNTGKILYECSMSKCDNESKSSPVGDVIVVQRQTQTIRAIEPRSGAERSGCISVVHSLAF